MSALYNRFAGESLDRLAALSDGVFAFSMTVLALNLVVPASSDVHSELGLLRALGGLLPRIIPYVMSFLTLGIFWVGQQTQLTNLTRSTRDLAWIHLGFLLAVTLMPFSTALLAAFITYRLALGLYWFNILLLGAMLFASLAYTTRSGLMNDDVTAEMRSVMYRRIIVAQALYAVGALLCVINTYVSIAAIVLVQLNYVFAPRIRALYRL